MATKGDIKKIVTLLNSAYRGKESQKGWTSEADLIHGDIRTTEEEISLVFDNPDAAFLKYIYDGDLVGCVRLEKKYGKIFLSMLSVKPAMQTNGIGKAMIAAAEEYAIESGCADIYITVISARKELLEWYYRRGFKDTGQRNNFFEDGVSGTHKIPLQFAVLEKKLNASGTRPSS